MKKLAYVLMPLLLVAGLSLTSCSSKESSEGSGSSSSVSTGSTESALLKNDLLSTVPASALAFASWDLESESYKGYRASLKGSPEDAAVKNVIEKLKADGSAHEFVPVLEALVDSGLIPATASAEPVTGKGVMFAGVNAEKKQPEVGIILAAAGANDLSVKLTTVQTALAKSYTIKKETYKGGEGFSVALADKDTAASNPSAPQLFVVANKTRLVASSTRELSEKILNGEAQNGIDLIKNSAEFKRAFAGVGFADDSLQIGFVNAMELGRKIRALAPEGQADFDAEKNPVESVAFTSRNRGGLTHTVLVATTPKTDEQKKVLAGLSGGVKGKLSSLVPAGTLALIGLDGQSIISIKNAIVDNMSAEEKQMLPPQLSLVDSLNSFGLAVRGGALGSPFPDLILLAETSNSEELEKVLLEQGTMVGAMTGLPGGWQQKEIGGVKSNFILTPFGVGIYLARTGGQVVLASSEKAVEDSLAVASAKSGSFIDTLPAGSKALVAGKSSLFVTYFDFPALAATIQGFQGSLAMFTGGQGGIDQAQLNELRGMGSFLVSLSFADNNFKIEGAYDKAPEAKAQLK